MVVVVVMALDPAGMGGMQCSSGHLQDMLGCQVTVGARCIYSTVGIPLLKMAVTWCVGVPPASELPGSTVLGHAALSCGKRALCNLPPPPPAVTKPSSAN